MNEQAIAKAGEIIAAKTDYVGGGMEGYAVLSLIDENGYPSASALTIAKADGINWLTFASSPDSNKAKRIAKCNKASVCIASPNYNITLVGTIEEVTHPDCKKASWCDVMNDGSHWKGFDDPNYYVMRFNTERYSIFILDGDEELGAVGTK
ncbi:MAG: pyridoxamine 5'-phosphate oxidase family protein [Defluviitaleaceae bacterium]|nr:pyridoxamine 5'-phosphate oxidase family protein [Defluviitaleaceae bacterium]